MDKVENAIKGDAAVSVASLDNLIVKYRKNPPNEDGVREIGCIEVIYPTTPEGGIPKFCVPLSEDNTDYQEIMKWVAEGNTIEEAD